MKKKKYLSVYFKLSLINERDSNSYLCNIFPMNKKLKLFYPTEDDFEELKNIGYATFAWAEGDTYIQYPDYIPEHHFTPLRKNILLFLAAMNNEL